MTNEDKNICMATCWGISLLAGVVAAAMLWLLGDWSFMQGAFVGALIFLVGGLLTSWLFCKPLPAAANVEPKDLAAEAAAKAEAREKSAAAAVAGGAVATAAAATAATASTTASRAADIKPSAPLKGQNELAESKGDWKYEAPAKPAAKKPATKKPAAKKPAAKAAAPKTTAKAATSKAATKPKAAASKAKAPARKPVAADGKPELLKKARAGGPDDLKQIKGVGPKLEKMLHGMGIYHFDQVAGWRKKEVQWVDENLEGFKGRVTRDDWVPQARVLAKGGTTEFSKKVKKGGVY